MTKPLAIDLFAGLGGWSEGCLVEGYDVVGFDIEQHVYGEHRYPAQLVIQDVLTLHGSQFKDAALIVASPPCQEYSYMAMPWSRAKAIAAEYRSGQRDVRKLTALFDACFRIQREASAAGGRRVPLVVENVRGAVPPALMPITLKTAKVAGFRFDGSGKSFQTASVEGTKVGGIDFNGYGTSGYKAQAFNGTAERRMLEGIKQRGSGREWFAGDGKISRLTSSKSPARKMASAMIAKIPLVLSRHVATYRPRVAL